MRTNIFIFVSLVLAAACKKPTEPSDVESIESDSLGQRVYSKEQLFNLADASFKLSDYESSLRFLDLIIVSDSSDGQVYFKKGGAYAGLMKYDSSTVCYLKAAKLGYKKDNCYYNIGLNHLVTNDSIAMYYFRKALTISPNHEKAKYHLDKLEKLYGLRKSSSI